MISFFVPGIGRPKGSKRPLGLKNGRTVMVEMSKREKPWRQTVTARAAEVMEGRERFIATPLRVVMDFGFPRPKKHYTKKGLRPDAPEWHTGTPDSSKLARSVEDALNGIVWDDDARIASLVVTKRYVDADELPGVRVEVEAMQ